MRTSRTLCSVILFLTPTLAWARTNPSPPEAPIPGLDDSPEVAQQAPAAPAMPSQAPAPAPAPMPPRAAKRVIRFGGPGDLEYAPMVGHEFGAGLGAWWKNSEIVSKLQLSDEQVKKISQTFLDHRLKLIDLQADLEKQELRLQPLLDADQPDEGKVSAQIDLITAARGRLEKENALMMLAIRRGLTIDQWKKLQSLQAEHRGKNFFFRTEGPIPPGAAGGAVIMKVPDAPEPPEP